MVLAELGQRISQALGSLNSVTVVDEAVRPLPCSPLGAASCWFLPVLTASLLCRAWCCCHKH